MSTFKYVKGAQLIGSGGVDLLTANINAMLVSRVYAPNRAADQFVAIIPPAAILVRTGLLTGLSLAGGVFSGTIPEIDAYLNPTLAAALVLYVETGNDALSTLLYYSSDGPGFPFPGQGLSYFIGYDQSNGGFFQV